MKKYLIGFFIAGLVIPVLVFVVHKYLLISAPLGGLSFILYIFLWPSSLGILDSSLTQLIFSIIFNSLYYSLLGYLLWFGINKSRTVLFVSVAAYIVVWGAIFIAFI